MAGISWGLLPSCVSHVERGRGCIPYPLHRLSWSHSGWQ